MEREVRTLDNSLTFQIKKRVNSVGDTSLFAVNRDGGVLLATGCFLLDVPEEFVEDGPQLQKLYATRDHKKANNIFRQIERCTECWRDVVFGERPSFKRASELDPNEREIEDSTPLIVFGGPRVRACYNTTYLEAVELLIPEARLKV